MSVHAPAGWQGSGIGARTQVPEDGKGSLRPPLQVPGVVYSSSFYFDLGAFLKHRDKFLTAQQRKGFEDFDKNTAKFLLGTRFSELASSLGPRHRLIVAQPDRKTYSVPTGITIPSFALVLELNDSERMGNKLAALLRGAAFLATFQARMDLVEEEHHGVKLVGYRFVDNEANRAIQNGLLFNFSPCFAQVGDQFLLCSSLELGRQLVARLQQEQKQPRVQDSILFVDVISWAGIADLLEQNKEQLVVQYMLERVQTPESAQKQADEVIRWLRHLGHLQFHFTSEAKSSRLEIHMKLTR
ncbi:MAG: hypothetical protein RMJ19_13060 [Gemmatales bacterium]|nr:hypothetical protein [Gemmatales bacterium]MDW8176598.1 hypothetical protein [Gemmatales bacterium]